MPVSITAKTLFPFTYKASILTEISVGNITFQ